MNARTALDHSATPFANDVVFNHDCKYFVVALNTGFIILTSDTCETWLEQELNGSTKSAAMLGTSQIIGLTSGGLRPFFEPNKLMLWDSAKREQTAAISARASIIRSYMTKQHIAIVMKNTINLYTHQPSIEKIASYDTVCNSAGLCCLGDQVLAFPGRTAGQIQLLNLQSRRVNIIPAHTSALRELSLSPDEQLVASASTTGTLVRVHSTVNCARLAELRRGVGGATIYSIAISPSGDRLAVTSDTSTLHVFEIPNPAKQTEYPRSSSPAASESRVSSISPQTGILGNVQKWGSLAKLPFAPRVFTDAYSFASARFDPGKEDEETVDLVNIGHQQPTLPKTRKGVLGWLDDETIVVINAGKDARYERFVLAEDDGKVVCVRSGWSRFLRAN